MNAILRLADESYKPRAPKPGEPYDLESNLKKASQQLQDFDTVIDMLQKQRKDVELIREILKIMENAGVGINGK